jgi:hypothetical protein
MNPSIDWASGLPLLDRSYQINLTMMASPPAWASRSPPEAVLGHLEGCFGNAGPPCVYGLGRESLACPVPSFGCPSPLCFNCRSRR